MNGKQARTINYTKLLVLVEMKEAGGGVSRAGSVQLHLRNESIECINQKVYGELRTF